MELGVITPQQGMEVLNKGIYPNSEDLDSAQKDFIEQRKNGMFNPIVGGTPMISSPPQPDKQSPRPQAPKAETGRPVGTSGIPQESSAKNLYSRDDLQKTIYKTEDLKKMAQSEMKNKSSRKRLNKTEKRMLDELCASVIISEDSRNWENKLKQCIKSSKNIESLGTKIEVQDIASEHKLDLYSAALLFHSKRNK
jgi:hypothetical protein